MQSERRLLGLTAIEEDRPGGLSYIPIRDFHRSSGFQFFSNDFGAILVLSK